MTRRWTVTVILCAAFAAAAAAFIAIGFDRGRGAWDQIKYHEPAIRAFAAALPRPDLSDYASATTPGYHLVLAAVARWVSPDVRVLQAAAALFTLGLIALFTRALAARAPTALDALILGAPMVCSVYVFSAGVWLLPDNAGWLAVLAVILLSLRHRQSAGVLIAAAAALTALVFVRQVHIWAAAAVWASALASILHSPDPADRSRPASRLLLAALATLPAFALLAYFLWLWKGLTPPTFQQKLHGGNPAAPAFILSLLAAYSFFYAGYLLEPLARLWRDHRPILLAAVALALAAAIIPATTYDTTQGRYSGLWNLIAMMDRRGLTLFGRTSPLLLLLAPIGAVAACAWLASLPSRRDRLVFAISMLAFLCAQSASRDLWQRYNEPFLLMMTALMASRVPMSNATALARRAPVIALSLLLLAVTVLELATAKPV